MAGALAGIKVVDLSRILAGPWASQMLADLGAQVIKVERPDRGDDTRYWGPPFIREASNDQPPQAAYFHCANRNKQSIAIDITHVDGQQIIRDLITDADVLIENYKVGGLAKYGLDYTRLSRINPKLVYCSITGFGQTGPCAEKAGYDAMIQGEGGLMSITGTPEGEPVKVGVALVDIMTGLYACNATLAALMARHQSQKGQYIDISLLDVQMATLANQGMNYLASGKNPTRLGNSHPNIVPYQTFASSDGSIILAVGNDSQFAKFCQIIDYPGLAESPLFDTNAQRVAHRSELVPLIAAVLVTQPSHFWIEALEKVSVPCGPVNTLEQVFDHPQIKHRKMVRQVPDRDNDMLHTIASPINLSATPVEYHSAPPALGQHTQQILMGDMKMSSSTFNKLLSQGIIG
ncbi:MAG: hypothetical protein OFPI_21370 [Osedax symbiont Rs2]|nr:MAG: hypothetical protein OFPI_21370 [Osedax symbiont Rs2]